MTIVSDIKSREKIVVQANALRFVLGVVFSAFHQRR